MVHIYTCLMIVILLSVEQGPHFLRNRNVTGTTIARSNSVTPAITVQFGAPK